MTWFRQQAAGELYEVDALRQRIAELENQVYKLDGELARKKQYINTGADQARAEERAMIERMHIQPKASSVYKEMTADWWRGWNDAVEFYRAAIRALGG